MPSLFLRLLPLPLLVCLLLAGCDSMPVRSQAPAVTAAEQAMAQGDFAAAAQAFVEAADSQRSQRDALLLRAAEAWREEGQLERSAQILANISSRRLDADALQRLGLLQAEIALSQQHPTTALEHLGSISSQLAPRYRARFLELRARANEADDNLFEAATARAELGERLPTAEQGGNRSQIQTLLQGLSDQDLAFGAAALPAGHPLYPMAARVLISRGLPLPHPLPPGERTEGDEGFATQLDGYRPRQRVALLLPLEGNLVDAARTVRDGFFAAYYNESRQRPEVRIYDTGSDPEAAVSAWQQARNDGAQAIVGPLGRDAVAAIFAADQEGSIPLLALNRGSEIPPPSGSMSFALTPEDEGTTVANRIIEHGGTRVIVIETGDEYGLRAAAAMQERLQQRNGHVVATARLPAGSPNYASAISSALSQAGSRRVIPESGDTTVEENRIKVEADAIFYTGRASEARLLVPQLRMAGIFDLPIHATSQITSGTGNARLDRELDGIEFTESPWLFRDNLPDLPSAAAVAGLGHLQGSSGRLFAFGMDAFLLLGHFDQIRRNPQVVLSGASGQLRFDGFGQIHRTPGWARFQGGRIQPAREGGLLEGEIQFQNP